MTDTPSTMAIRFLIGDGSTRFAPAARRFRLSWVPGLGPMKNRSALAKCDPIRNKIEDQPSLHDPIG
jgi:hypothetical protein